MSNFVNLLDIIYPVGSIYITTTENSPADSIGGTWVKIEGRFLRAADSGENSTETGGSKKHHHVVAMLWPEYFGWSNISGTKDKGYSPSSGIACMSGEAQDGDYSTSFSSGNNYRLNHLIPVHTGSSGASNYVSNVMSNNNCYVTNTFVNVQYGSTTSESSLPPYYNVYCYYRTA